MMDDRRMSSRFAAPTPRSRRLGRALRQLRERAGLRLEDVAPKLGYSVSKVQRVETGEIRPREADVLALLTVYAQPTDDEQASELIALVRAVREPGWWQRFGTLPPKYVTFVAYEEEASDVRNWEPSLIPGLLQTPDYAKAIGAIGRETETAAIEEWAGARMRRREVLTRKDSPLRLHVVISETALLCEVGGPEVLREQLKYLALAAAMPNVSIQVLRFAAGAHLADRGPFALLTFERVGDPPLGYIETLAGSLFLESPEEIARLGSVFDHLTMLALSPAESVKLIEERVSSGKQRR